MREYSEGALIEQLAIALLQLLHWQHANCFRETFGASGSLGRETAGEVVLVRRLRAALAKLNPRLPAAALDGDAIQATQQLTRDRSAMSLAAANREVYVLLKDGIKVSVRDARGEETRIGDSTEAVRVIDWNAPANNDFFLASQLWIAGEMHRRRTDLVGFVNGIPLVFVELKATHRRLQNAYQDNHRDYKDTITHAPSRRLGRLQLDQQALGATAR